MHIKQITISNFRSFRQQGEIQPFSAGTNTVVGRNGSGKSNLFDAVQFCLLAPRFAHLRQEERQALLHEGSGSAAVNAFVEIIFDNSDHRFQHENSDEVVLRRTIGLKKDEFFLQRKRTNKSEIQSLLEGAGFSKSNPYFIVQQGKVQDLCTMSDAARLRLLKEVAGTTVYDEKKSESMAKMEENRASIENITEMLCNIEERLQELNAEKDELTAYQQLDRERRAAQYSLYSLELQKARTQLEQIEQDRKEHFETLETFHNAMKETHDAIRRHEETMKTQGSQLRRVRQAIAGLEEDKKDSVMLHTRLDLECKELEEALVTGDEQAAYNKTKLDEIEREIARTETELREKVGPTHEEAVQALQAMVVQRTNTVKQTEALYAKQGRGRKFRSAADRDAYLEGHRSQLEAAKSEKENELSQQHDTLANLRRNVNQSTADIKALQKEVSQKSAAQKSLNKSMNEKCSHRVEQNDARRENWRLKEELQEQVREARETLHSCQFDAKKVMPRATANGIEALRQIVDEEKLVRGKHYFGMLMENMTLKDPKFQAAVEAAAQNSLFHVIVDTDHTAARLMKRLEEGKLGRLTFLPINQLRIDPVAYPDSSSKDVVPLLDLCLSYSKGVERVMQHVFSRKLIARSKESASEWSVKVSMDAITLDGDLFGRKGALTGGFIDTSRSRLGAYARQMEAEQQLSSVEVKYNEVKTTTSEIEMSIQNVMKEIQRLEAKQAELNREISTKESTLDQLETRGANHKKQIDVIESTTIPDLERSMADIDGDIKRLSDEMGTELQQTLTTEERELVIELKSLQDSLGSKIEAQREIVDTTGLEKQKLQSLLENNLLLRRRDLTNDAIATADEGADRRVSRGRLSIAEARAQKQEDLVLRAKELEAAARTVKEHEGRLKEQRTVEADVRKDLGVAKNEYDKLKEQDMQELKALEEAQDKSDRFMAKRSLFSSKRESNLRKIQELGSLPPPAEIKKFSGKSVGGLEKTIDIINSKLKKYSHVNKKAFDQYVNFNETRMRLLNRKEELDHSADKVQELIESLDLKKDEAINRTFRGVSGHFKDVFKELVPNGAGEVIMRTELDNETDMTDVELDSSDDISEQGPSKNKKGDKSAPDVSMYRGIGIKVRFSDVGENFIMSQLSGGQKALVALALIFAIQRCDPAPFYLFDELDQALDSTYRAAVARLIQRQANSKETPTQFIVSTFRQELVAVANRCYGISHQNKVSSLHHMPKQDAQLFIANLNQDEEAVGDVTSLATSKVSAATRESRKRKSANIGSNVGDTEAADEADVTDGEEGSETSDMVMEHVA